MAAGELFRVATPRVSLARFVEFKSVPRVLHLQLMRFTFDPLSGTKIKLKGYDILDDVK